MAVRAADSVMFGTGSSSRTGDNDDSDVRRKSCVSCNAVRPPDGKLLACLHVMCGACLQQSVQREPDPAELVSVKCTRCSELTRRSPELRSFELLEQLPDCHPALYNTAQPEVATAQSSSKSSGEIGSSGAGAEAEGRLCDVCVSLVVVGHIETAQGATHQCFSCVGGSRDARHVFCLEHAESHRQTRRYANHKVEQLARVPTAARSGSVGVASRRRRCPVHRHHYVINYCQTCQRALCEQCLSDGHNGHTFDSLESAARELRGRLSQQARAYSDMCPQQSADGAAAGHFSLLFVDVAAQLDAAKKEAEEMSTTISDTFSCATDMLKQAEKDLLGRVEQHLWNNLNPLEVKREHLCQMKDQEATAIELTKSLASGECGDLDAIHLANVVVSGLSQLRTALEEEIGQSSMRQKFTAVPAPVSVIEEDVRSWLCLGQASLVRARFDPKRCSPLIALSNDGLIASYRGPGDRYGSVAGLADFSSGAHSWRVKLHCVRPVGEWNMLCGVTARPDDGNYAGTDYCFDKRRCYGWWSSGVGQRFCGKAAGCSRLVDGDIILLELDMEKKTLSINVPRTDCSQTISGIACDKPLYPAVCMCSEGQKAEMLGFS